MSFKLSAINFAFSIPICLIPNEYINLWRDTFLEFSIDFCKLLESICIETIEEGKMTKDLALLVFRDDMVSSNYLTTEQFFKELKNNLEKKIKGV